jgi:hypothetical protein
MSNENLLSRRAFTLETALAILGAATITITGCGDDDPGTGPTLQPGDKEGSVSANHGHRAIITAAQISGANVVSLNIRGTATHAHTVSLSQAEVISIGANTRVTTTSTSDDGHNHTVTFN